MSGNIAKHLKPITMNITEIKSSVSEQAKAPITKLDMQRQKDVEGNPTEWYSHWDNVHRVRVVMHEELFTELVKNKSLEGLALKPAVTVTPEGKSAYMRFVVIKPVAIEASF